MKPERIAKVMARAGLCSRREAERWIENGRVEVDGTVITTPATLVTEDNNIRVDNAPLPQIETARLWCFHKPTDTITSNHDPQGRETIFDTLPQDLPRVITVGRLDYNSEGLLLLTNDGELARHLELPATGWERHYRVRIHGQVNPTTLASLENGITIDDITYGPIVANIEKQSSGTNSWLTFTLQEGKNREIRRVCDHLGLQVNRLIRTSYGSFQLGNLSPREVKEVPRKALEEQLGDFL